MREAMECHSGLKSGEGVLDKGMSSKGKDKDIAAIFGSLNERARQII